MLKDGVGSRPAWLNDGFTRVGKMVEALAVTGRVDECRRRLGEQWAGMDVHPIVSLPWGAPLAVLQTTLEALAPLPRATVAAS